MTGKQEFGVEDALDLANASAPEWNADGSRVGYLRFADGTNAFAAADVSNGDVSDDSKSDGGEHEQPDGSLDAGERQPGFGPDDGDVTGFDWRPETPEQAAIVADGDVELLNVTSGERTTLLADEEEYGTVSWAPDGDRLAVHRDDRLLVHDRRDGSTRTLVPDGPTVATLFGPTPIEWSPDGRYLATTSTADEVLGVLVYDLDERAVAWHRSPDREEGVAIGAFDWVDSEQLVYAEESADATERRYFAVGIEDGNPTPILSERDDRGLARDEPVGGEDGRFAVLSARTGRHHVYVVDADRRREAVEEEWPGFEGRGVVQLTDGAFEARGDAIDAPAWSDDGARLAYVTNEHDPGERQLHVAEIGDGNAGDEPAVESVERIAVSGNALYPTWSGDGRLACIRAGERSPADVHVSDRELTGLQRVSRVYPDPERLSWLPEPEPVSFEGTGGVTVRGYLYTPPDAEQGDDRPAVIWAHGGPLRQMRRGFHHMRSYATFHAFNHVLVSRGYVVLELNYRGGIGYGREFEHGIDGALGEDDVDDCVRAAEFLRDQPAVGDSVGLWGLSYGGFLAAALATDSDAVDCTVNFAGVWDWADWIRYASDRHWGAGSRFAARFGGHPDEDDPAIAERYEIGSPATDADSGLETPMFALHGTDDPNVPFAQMDALVDALVGANAEFEMAYYPDEDHMFRDPDVWRDALGRVLPYLDDHLR